jgi:predicted RNA-binding Zn ribbon-like protein
MSESGVRAPAPGGLSLVQTLVNTLDIESGRDELGTPEALASLGIGRSDLDGAAELREALRDVCLAHTGTDLPEESAATLDRLLGGAPLVLAIDAQGGAVLRPAEGLTGAAALTARIAAGIAAAAADGSWPRLKACEAHDCRWVYYDRSPGGRSRWCSMRVCGSRAKMRAYRARSARPG